MPFLRPIARRVAPLRLPRHQRPLVLLFLLPLPLVVGCHRSSDRDTATGTDRPGPRVIGDSLMLAATSPELTTLAATPAARDTSRTLTLNGRVVWNEEATARVFSPFAGRVVRVVANVGQSVAGGTELAAVAAPDFGQAQADARRASTDLSMAERTLVRQRDLLEHGVVAQKDVEAAEADVERTRAEAERARARLALYGGDSTSFTQVFALRSPVRGVVVERNLTPGQEVRPDQMLANAPQLFAPLFVVTDPARMWVMLDVPERDTKLLRPGLAITLRTRALPDQTFHGTITVTSGALDPASRTMKVRAVVENPAGALRAEMLAVVDVQIGGGRDVVVPASAVVVVGEAQIVFVEQQRGRYVRRAVQAGAAHDGLVPVSSGLAVGDRVITSTPLLLEQLFQSAPRA